METSKVTRAPSRGAITTGTGTGATGGAGARDSRPSGRAGLLQNVYTKNIQTKNNVDKEATGEPKLALLQISSDTIKKDFQNIKKVDRQRLNENTFHIRIHVLYVKSTRKEKKSKN